jgi:hypothetical protein
MKIKDLKKGMKLRSVKNVYYINFFRMNEVVLEEDLDRCLIIEKGSIREVVEEDNELYLMDEDGELNEGFFDLKDMLDKKVFEIV